MIKIRCNRCRRILPSSAYYPRKIKFIRQPCKDCTRIEWKVSHARRKNDPSYLKSLASADRKHRLNTRFKILALYGNVCACCGEDKYEFLGIDHIDGGGKKHRAGFASYPAYLRWLLEEKREGFRILCHNCNLSCGFYGYCPHEANSQTGTQDGTGDCKLSEWRLV